jgi:hypothetical protein
MILKVIQAISIPLLGMPLVQIAILYWIANDQQQPSASSIVCFKIISLYLVNISKLSVLVFHAYQ